MRLWSSTRGRQLLVQISEHVPAALRGGIASRSASDIFVYLAAIIEETLANDTGVYGDVFDLVKAYNVLPRGPVAYGAKRLGLTAAFVDTWMDYLNRLQRSFRVAGILGEPFGSTCGFPEGCCMSVLAMIIIGWTYQSEIESSVAQAHGHVETLVYADNLEVFSTEPASIMLAEKATTRWAACLTLEIAITKSWRWGSRTEDAAEFEDSKLTRLHHARDLGADMNYGARRLTKVQQARVTIFGDTCRRVAWLPVGNDLKATAVSIKALPGVLYGVEITGISKSVMGKLRSAAARGILKQKREQRRFAGTVRADQADFFASVDVKRHLAEQSAAGVGFADIGNGEHAEFGARIVALIRAMSSLQAVSWPGA
jgi:hypothetical protein